MKLTYTYIYESGWIQRRIQMYSTQHVFIICNNSERQEPIEGTHISLVRRWKTLITDYAEGSGLLMNKGPELYLKEKEVPRETRIDWKEKLRSKKADFVIGGIMSFLLMATSALVVLYS